MKLPHWFTIYDEIVFYCPILNDIFIYQVGFYLYEDNIEKFKKSGLVYLGEL